MKNPGAGLFFLITDMDHNYLLNPRSQNFILMWNDGGTIDLGG